VNVALNGLPKLLEPFVKGVCARENIPYWKRLWDDCIQEETREDSKSRNHEGSEENLDLVSKTRKVKGKGSRKKGNSDGGSSQLGKKKDLSKNKFFSCHKKKGNVKKQKKNQQRHNLMSLQQNLRRITQWFLSFLLEKQ
jgi:hypothetical protein